MSLLYKAVAVYTMAQNTTTLPIK